MADYTNPPREYAEWCNYWCESGSDYTKPRVLLIGDSITNSYRAGVQALYPDKNVLVDMVVGSRCAGDPALEAEIQLAAGPVSGYTYDVIHFNNGLHGGCNDTMIGLEPYVMGMTRCIELLKKLQPKAKLILATSTVLVAKGGEPGVWDKERNAFVLNRNDAVRKLAEKYGCSLDDLFELVTTNAFAQPDGCHYGEEGRAALAKQVFESVEALRNA